MYVAFEKVEDLKTSIDLKEKIVQALSSDLQGLRKEHVEDLKKANEDVFKSRLEV